MNTLTLPNLVSIDLQTMEIRRGVESTPYLVDFSDPIPFRVKVKVPNFLMCQLENQTV